MVRRWCLPTDFIAFVSSVSPGHVYLAELSAIVKELSIGRLKVLAQAKFPGRNPAAMAETGDMVEAARTLMKSEPELSELIAEVEGVEVTMAEKGFGTRVELRAADGSGLLEADLEAVLDQLAEPQRRPFV
jgi:hypothetical protein